MKSFKSKSSENESRTLMAEQLEPRILYSATPGAEPPQEVQTSEEAPAESVPEETQEPAPAEAPAPTAQEEISSEALLDPETPLIDAENQTVYLIDIEQVEAHAAAAADRWEATGLSQAQQDALASITYRIGDLGGYSIGQTDGNVITIDDDAAGLGWFFDTTPDFDEEFEIALGEVGTSYLSNDDDAASRAIDLLSVILHEQGHILGLEDLYDDSLIDGAMHGVFEVGERSLASFNEAEGAEALSLVGPQYATVNATWTGAGDGTSWNDAANWNGTAPSTVGILTIDTPEIIDSVFREGTTDTYADGFTFRGIVNLDQGTIDIGHYFGTGSNNGSQGVFNIGDGSGTGDAIVNISDGGQWEFDRHSNGIYTINIASDGELNATGTGFFDTYVTGDAARGWAINVNGGKLTSEAAWTMNDNGGNTHPITISNGGQVNLGVINLVGEVIDFADADAGNSFTAAFGGSFADIDAVNAAIGTTFTSTGGEPIFVQDNGGTFTVNFNAPPVFVNDTDLADNTINENALVDAPVGITASFSDPEGATLTYSLRDDAGGRFKIDSSTGVVSVANPALLSFAGAASHEITVEASDGTTGIGIEDFTIAVTLPAWTGDGDGTSWNDGANWGGTAPGQTGTLNIDTTDTLTNLYRDTGTVLYNNGATFRGTANLNQGTIEIDHYFGTGPSGGGFNIGDGSGTADAIVNVVDGGTWEFDRHSGGTYTININSDGQLNATGTGTFQTYANTPTRQWVINVDGGTLTSEADWNMRGNGSDDNQLNISSGATVDLGAIFLENTVINFSDANADNSFTATFDAGANSFADIAAVNAAIGTTFTTSAAGVFVGATDNGDGTFSVNAAVPTLSSTDIIDDRFGNPILAAQPVTYTLNFSHGMDLSTITVDDFENAGSASITIDSISQGADGEVTVVVTPGLGDLQLQIKAGTDIRDSGGNALDTTAAITDDTTISVVVNFAPVAADDTNTVTEAGGLNNTVTVVGGDGSTLNGTSGTVFEQVGTELSLTPPVTLIQGSIRNDGGNDTEAHLAGLTSDTFTYDPLDPTSDLPTQGYSISANPAQGVHGNTNGDVIFQLAVDSPVTIHGQTQVVVDLYGRNGNPDRDNDIDILFIAADGSVLGQLNGQAIDGASDHLRVSSQGVVPIGGEIAAIRIVGHDSDSDPNAGNSFTLMEVRAAVLVGDTDADSTDQAVPHDGTVNVTNIAYTGTPFQNTNTGGAVVGATSIDGHYGTLTINPDGTYTYLLDADASDPLTSSDVVNEVFTYTIEDGNEDGGVDTATATLTIAITGADDINLPPVAVDDTNTAVEAGGTANSDTTFGGDGVTASGTSGTVFEQTGSVIPLTAPTALNQGSLLLFNGNTEAEYLASILNDTFAFDPLDPTAATPDTFYSTGATATGLHGTGNGDIIFTMTVDSPVTIDGENQVVVDLYGRNQNQFRDNDIDVLFLAADGVTILGQVNGVAISDTGVPHVRVSSAGVVATGAVIGQIRIVGHDSDDDPASGNAFTLMEMRASEIIGDYDPNVSDQTVPHDGTVNVTNIAFTGTPFQATNTGGEVSGETAIDGQYGTLTINPDGTYVYLLDLAASDSLTSSDAVTEEFTYTIEDGNEDGGADSTATLTITVTGADDTPAPPVAIDDTDTVTEAGGVGNATETVGGDGSTPSGTSGTVFPGPGGPLTLQNPTIERGGNAFGGTIEGTLNDDFAYDYADPTAVMPITAFGANQAFHNDPNTDGDVELRYDLASPVTVAATTNIVVDLYGRNGSKDRDDDIDIQFLDANNNVLGEVLGAGIDDNTDHVRVSSLDANLAIGAVVAKIRLIAHDTDSDPAVANSFTLQEIRAALLSDSDGDATDNVFPHDGSVNVTNITVTGTPFQATNPGGAVAVGTTSANGTRIDGVYGTLTIGADGTYRYALDPTASDSLAALAEVNEVFAYTIEDGNEDGGTDDVTATLTIAVTGTNDAPTVTADTAIVQENAPDGTFVHQVVAADADAGATLSYAITAGNTDSAFAIDPGTGEITVNSTAALDFETTPSFSLTVSVTDDQTVTTNETITVTLQDIPNLVFVDDTFAGTANGAAITDADLGENGDQGATFGVNAFATIQEAIDAVEDDGVIIINSGTYAESISLADGKTIEITGPDTAGTVAIDSLETTIGTEVIIEGASTLTVGAGNTDSTIAGIISGTGNFEKTGTAELTLSGANTYAGSTNVAAGILIVANDTALGATSGTTTVGTTFNDGAALHFTGDITVAEDIILTGGNSGVIRNVSGDNTITGEITLNGNSDFRRNAGRMTISGGIVSAANQNLSLNGVFTVDTNPIDLNNGRLTITSNSNSLANANILNVGGNDWGQTRISFSGYLLMGGENFLPADTEVSIGHDSNAGRNRGTLDLGGFDQTVALINTTAGALGTPSDQTITGGGTLTINQASGEERYQGRITDGASATNLVLNGAGTLILENLSGNTNSYTGTTTINGGTLALEADTQLDQSSEIAIATGATFDVTARTAGNYVYPGDLSGTGTVVGALTVGLTGSLQPGANGGDDVGTLALTGDTTISGDYEFTVDGGTTDLITVVGEVILGGTLTFNVINDPTASTITVIDNDAADQITTFFGQAEGSVIVVGTKPYTITYTGGDGNDVVLEEVAFNVVYVDDSFAGTANGDTIADADLGTNGAQAATFGVNAFATIQEAIDAVADNGTIIINAGIYAEGITLADGKIIEITGPDGAAQVSIDSLATAIGTEVIIEGTSTLTVGLGDTDSSIAGIVSGSGNLTKVGTGSVTLSGANTYTGTTTLAVGTLVADAVDVAATSGALGNGGDITFTGGTLQYTANSSATDYSARFADSTSEISLDTNGQDVTLAVDIANTNSGGLTKLGLGELIVEFDSAYTGLTSVDGGTLELFNDDVFNAGWRGDNKGNFAVNNGSTLEFNTAGGNREIFQAVTFTFDASGGGTIDFVSGGFIFQDIGVGNTFTTNGGATNTIRSTDNSILNLQFSNRLIFDVADGTDEIDLEFGARINDGEIIKNGAGTLAVTNSANNLGVDTNGGTVPNTVTINAGTLELAEDGRLQSGDFAGEIINNGILRHNSTADQILSGVISGTGDLVKANTGVLELGGANTYTGSTTIQSGLVRLNNFTALGASTNAADGTVVESGGALDLNGQRTRLTERITINGDGLAGDPDTGALFNGSTINMVNDGVQFLTLGSDASIGNAGDAGVGRFGLNAGTIDGAFTLTKVGGNAVWLSSNVTVANLVIEDGFYGIQGDNALNNITGTVTIEDDGTLATFSNRNLNADIISNDGTIQSSGSGGVGAISLGGTLELTGNDNILLTTGDTILTINSVISGTGGLVKNGTGQTILTGSNTFSGPTAVNAAILTVNGSNTGGGAYTVISGATLEGDGSITGDVTSQTGSVVSAGDDLGDLAITGAVNVGGQYLFEFNGNNATRDLLDVTGTVTLGAASTLNLVDLDDIQAPAATGAIVLIQNDGTDPVVGNFMGLAEGATVTDDDGGQYTISYFGGDGNDVVLFVGIPETLVSFAGGTLTISDIATDSADALDISYDAGTDEYVITDPNLNLSTAGLGDGQFSRPDANTVRVAASIVTGLVVDTVNGSGDASADTVTLASLAPTALTGDVSITAETIHLDTSISTTGGDITLTGATTLSADTLLDGTNVSLLGAVDLGASELTIDVTGTTGVSTGGISGTGGLIKDGTGRFTMNGSGSPTNSYTGLTLVREGDLEVGGSFATDGAIQGDLTIEDGGTLKLLQNEIIAGTSDLTVESNGTVDWNFRVEAIGSLDGAGDIVNNTNFQGITLDEIDGTHTFSGTISGFNGNPAGGVIIRGNEDNSGTQVFSGATLDIASFVVADGTATITNNTIVNNTGGTTVGTNRITGIDTGDTTGILNIESGTYTTTNFNSGDRLANTVIGTINQTGGSVTTTGVIAQDNAGIRLGHFPNSTSTYHLSGGSLDVQAGDIAIGINGNGIFNQTGGTLTASDIVVNARDATGTGAASLTGGTVNLGAGGITTTGGPAVLTLGGDGYAITPTADTSIAVDGTLQGTGADALTLNTAGFDITVSSVLSGAGGLAKTGAGELILTGDNTYLGATDLDEGTLTVNGVIGNGAPADTLTIAGGATLAGSGRVNAMIAVNSGNVSPGDDDGDITDTLTISDLDFGTGTFTVDLDGATDSDQLDVTGTVDLATSTLVINSALNLAFGSTITLVSNDGADPVLSTFDGLPEGTRFTDGTNTFVISYRGGDGNDITLSVINPNAPVEGDESDAGQVTVAPASPALPDVFADVTDDAPASNPADLLIFGDGRFSQADLQGIQNSFRDFADQNSRIFAGFRFDGIASDGQAFTLSDGDTAGRLTEFFGGEQSEFNLTPFFSGIGRPGASVIIQIFDGFGIPIAETTTTTSLTGDWYATFPGADLSGDDYRVEISIISVDLVGDLVEDMVNAMLPGSLLIQPDILEGMNVGEIFGATLETQSSESPEAAVETLTE